MAITDPDTLHARAIQYREKAAELREYMRRSPALQPDFLKQAKEYENMADQLDNIVRDRR